MECAAHGGAVADTSALWPLRAPRGQSGVRATAIHKRTKRSLTYETRHCGLYSARTGTETVRPERTLSLSKGKSKGEHGILRYISLRFPICAPESRVSPTRVHCCIRSLAKP
jgi:hypothetical protein